MNTQKKDLLVEMQSVSLELGGNRILTQINVAVASAEKVALIGPSGSGKSTILRLLIGLLWPQKGTIRLGGETITPRNIQTMRRQMGYVIQEGGLFPHLTAAENISLAARYRGQEQVAIASRLDELCQLTQIPKTLLQRYPSELSGGQRQRIALMRALFHKPPLLLLDEPMAALDPLIKLHLQRDLATIISTLKQTVILVTHDLAEAQNICHRLILLQDGAIVADGSAKEIRKSDNSFAKRFIAAQEEIHNVQV
jgi:osmoprotectant transport system ATP-binding protein